MKMLRATSMLPLLAGLALSACEDGGPSQPAVEDLAVEDQIALELLSDPTFAETALDLVNTQTAAANRRGRPWGAPGNGNGGGGSYALQAQVHFQNAQAELAQGNINRALVQARRGRELVAQGIEAAGGPWAIQAMLERLEDLPLAVNADPDCYQDPQGLGLKLGQLAQGARKAWGKGRSTEAGQLGVLGEQAVRQRLRDGTHTLAGRPEIWVELGQAAVDLATSLIDEGTADTEQLDLLATAVEFEAQAVEALEAGYIGRAIHFAHLAQWYSLKAVVLPGGVTEEEAQALLTLAETLLEEARTAVGAEPTELQTALLERAARLLESGSTQLEGGVVRGIGALWQSAVVSTYLIG